MVLGIMAHQGRDVVETAVVGTLKSPEDGRVWKWMLHKELTDSDNS
jgi:hypothetical protein